MKEGVWEETTLFGDRKIRAGESETEREKQKETERLLHNFHFLPSTLKVMFYLTGSSLRGENDKSNPKFNSLCSVQRAHSVLYSP